MLRKLKDKNGSALIWAVIVMLAGLTVLAASLLHASTYSMASGVKGEVRTSSISVLQNNYIESAKGYGDSTLSGQEILDYMAGNYSLLESENGGKKVDSNGKLQYSISDLSVTAVENKGRKPRTLQGFRVTFTFSRPIIFGGKALPDVSIPITMYVWYTPNSF